MKSSLAMRPGTVHTNGFLTPCALTCWSSALVSSRRYAGAKRTQLFIANYSQKESDRLGLGLRFKAIAPRTMPDTPISGRTLWRAIRATSTFPLSTEGQFNLWTGRSKETYLWTYS